MYRKITIGLIVLLLFSVHAYAKTTTYGKGIHLQEETKVSDLLDKPEMFLGKKELQEEGHGLLQQVSRCRSFFSGCMVSGCLT